MVRIKPSVAAMAQSLRTISPQMLTAFVLEELLTSDIESEAHAREKYPRG